MSKSKAEKGIVISEKYVDTAIISFAKHPYIWTLFFCLLLHPFYFGSDENVPKNAVLIESSLALAAGFAVVFLLYRFDRIKLSHAYILSAVVFAANFFLTIRYSRSFAKGAWLFIGGSVIVLTLYYFSRTKRFKEQLFSLMIMAVSFLLKFYYVYYTSVYTRQNDVHLFGGDNGHAGYMEYLLYEHHLPDFDVRDTWGFCHPPLHHIISAVWIYINKIFSK